MSPIDHEALQRRLDRRIAQLGRYSARYVRLRVGLFLLLLAGIGLPLPGLVSALLTGLSVGAFVAVARLHRLLDRSIARHHAWKRIKRAQQARRTLDWETLPPPMQRDGAGEHLFAGDLGLFGPASLHRLLDMAVSHRGSALLADWLSDPAPVLDRIRERQKTVRALVPLAHFREHLQLEYAMVAKEKLDGDAFLSWIRTAALPRSIRWALPVSMALAAINAALFFLWGFDVLGPWWLLGLLVYGAVYFKNTHVREAFVANAIRLDVELGRLKTVFRFLERYPMKGHPVLEELTAEFRDARERPSRHIRGILRDVVAAGLSMNPVMFILLNAAFPWDFFFASRLERKRREVERLLPRWLDALHRLEALQSLANLAALHPEYAFPEVTEAGGDAVFDARGLGHPLIPHGARVTNDFRIERSGTVFLVTGSNMSGKSTFLRTVGINLVLAYAGGPVAAQSLAAQLFRLYTCIQISDSLREGVSYFYAEVRRLRGLLERLDAGDAPVFFLIDEIFKGTNNIERHVGSEAYLQALAGRRGTGIVSTHDIDLTALPERVEGMINLHFREHISDGRMQFDYRLRSGPCPTTNALTIMRLEGLPVPDQT